MELEGFQEPLPPEALISNAVERFDDSNHELMTAMREMAQNPSSRNNRSFNERSVATLQSFKDAVRIIAGCEELPIQDRAGHIAAICVNSERVRLDFLRDVSPGGKFQDPGNTHEEFSGMFEELLDEDRDADEIVNEAADIYVNSFSADLGVLIVSAEPSTKAKMRYFMQILGSEALDFGKLAAAVAAGTLISHHILKRRTK